MNYRHRVAHCPSLGQCLHFQPSQHSYHVLLPGAWQAGSVEQAVNTLVPSMDVAHTAGSLTSRHYHGEWHKALSGSLLGPTRWLASWRCCIGINTLHHTLPFFPPMASRFFIFILPVHLCIHLPELTEA